MKLDRVCGIVLTLLCSANAWLHSAPGDEFWDDRFDVLGIDGEVWAIAVMGNDVYVGGQFTRAGNVAASNIARWDGTNWWPLGSGVGGAGVRALAVQVTNLFVGGFFTNASGISVSGVARWDGNGWSDLDGGVNGSVRALAVGGTDILYAGGHFSRAGGVIASNIAVWSGNAWWPLGAGVSHLVEGPTGMYFVDFANVLALAADRDRVYVGGEFTRADGVSVRNLAKWNGAEWSAVDREFVTFGAVQVLAMIRPYLHVGGTFYPAATVGFTNVVRWDGVNWSYMGGGLEADSGAAAHYVRAFAVHGQELFVGGGGFQKLGSTGLAKWDGANWEGLGSGQNRFGEVNALAVKGNQLFVGGRFSVAGGKPARNFSIWHIPEKLRIRRSQNAMELSWPLSLSNFVLEASAQLPGSNWTEVRKPPALQNDRFSVTDEATVPQQFYRLRKRQ